MQSKSTKLRINLLIMKALIFSLLLSIIFLASCKKEVNPTLYVNVVNQDGKAQEGLTVVTHPCYDESCDLTQLNSNLLQSKLSDASGSAEFDFNTSAVLDVVVEKYVFDPDGEVVETITFADVVSIETKQLKKGEKNEYETTIITD